VKVRDQYQATLPVAIRKRAGVAWEVCWKQERTRSDHSHPEGGAVIALAAARTVRGMLVNVSHSDPLLYVLAAVSLGLVAALASYVLALPATRVDPMVALRSE
jgi:hypothetical protein